MDHDLPNKFDLIVVGTGLIESIISAAASRIGKTVLHIDSNDYYGGYWASFNLEAFTGLTNKQPNPPETDKSVLKLLNNVIPDNLVVEWHIPEEQTEENVSWSRASLLKDSRKFNLDLTPKLHFARGEFVELLISSNIARYSEFRSISRVLTWLNGQLEVVPCSRSDIFANDKVTVVEKRMLMKLFTSLENDDVISGYENKTFKTFLKEKKLTSSLIHYVLYAIAMGTDETSCPEGISRVKRFLNSLGRFGKTPFLYSSYGSGEITQAFCRLSAVFGGVYALNQKIKGLVLEKDTVKGVICDKQEIQTDFVVLSAEKLPENYMAKTENFISRAILITDNSILKDEREHLTLLLYPPENGNNSVTVIEAGHLTGTCPPDLFVVHLITKQTKSPQDDFKDCIENLFKGNLRILWSSYFSIPDFNDVDFGNSPKNCFVCPGPDLDLDYDFSINKAKEMFQKMYPDLDFLPRAPDPEEIIIEGEEALEVIPEEEIAAVKETKNEEKGDYKDECELKNDENEK